MNRCALLVALLIVAGSAAQANPVALSDTQRVRLEHGEIVVLDVLPPGGSLGRGQGGTALTLVNAPLETVWRVLVDYPHHSGLYPRVTSAEVLEADADHALVRYVVGLGPFSFGFHVNNYPDEARGRLVWRLDRDRRNGLFRDTWGYWQVEPRGYRVCQDHALAARLDLPVAPRVAEKAVAPVAVEAPHEAAACFVRVVVHVEAERERAQADDVANERMVGVRLEHLGAGDAGVEPRVVGIIHEHSPHRLEGRIDEREGGSALP